jgi:hypothetical protein
MSAPTSPGTPRSAASSSSSAVPPQEVVAAKEILNMMKNALDPLHVAFDSLEKQVGHIAMLGGHETEQLNPLRKRMQALDRKQQHGIEEIQLLLNDVLQKQIGELMKQEIEREYADQIDRLVEEQVAACLMTHIPQELQDEVAKSKRELEALQRALHNSESRRANASLRVSDPTTVLHTIYTPTGEISADYPKSLGALKDLDAETSKRLMIEYLIPDPLDERERNLNRFMQFCGLPYQIVSIGFSNL